MRSIVVILAVVSMAAWAIPAAGQEWAREMFETHEHHFGTLARGSKAEYAFRLTNPYLETVRIARVRTTCGCGVPRVEKDELATYESGAVIVEANTTAFTGHHSATITVTFDQPYRAEVQLYITVYVRGDVVFEPESVAFGQVDQGEAREERVAVEFTRGADREIVEIRSANEYLSAEAVERTRGGGRTVYELLVRLEEGAPPGYLADQIILVTNEPRNREIPLLVEGQVLSAVSASPSSLFLGVLKPGAEVTRQVVLRARRPFRITGVEGESDAFRVGAAEDEARPLHLVPVTFVAREEDEGRVAQTLRFTTDLEGADAEVAAYGVVAP